MDQTHNQESFHSIINLGKELHILIQELNVEQIEKKLPEYTRKIEQYFLEVDKAKLTQPEFDKLKQLMSMHNKVVNLISEEKETISKKLKQLHIGKAMQHTYPQAAY